MIANNRLQIAIDYIKANSQYLLNENLDELYRTFHMSGHDFTCCLTQVLLDADIKSWEYLTTTYSYMYINVENVGSVNVDNLQDDVLANKCFSHCPSVTEVTLPNDLQIIGEQAFEGCDKLEKISIGPNVSNIYIGAFNKDSHLKHVYIKDLSAWLAIDFEQTASNPLYYGAHLYLNNEEVTELRIPSTLKSFSVDALAGADWITSIYVPKQIIALHLISFIRCKRLQDIYYESTKEEWLHMTFNNQDIEDFKNKITIHCTDGRFEL